METPESVIPQTVPMIEINTTKELFFKCPVGGFASLRPGICPKCKELLIAVGDTLNYGPTITKLVINRVA